jgi:hypothetical protein
MPPIFPLGFVAMGGGETDSSRSMGGRMDESQRRANATEIVEKEGKHAVGNQRDLIAN